MILFHVILVKASQKTVKGKKVVLDYFSPIFQNKFCQNPTNNDHVQSALYNVLKKLEYFQISFFLDELNICYISKEMLNFTQKLRLIKMN